ncbi:MAG: F420-dependent oxidoreductase [Thaumarchaeota archaeon]|nr:F420-dependent oxidoreductase [Nitrososphaerota archaeon]
MVIRVRRIEVFGLRITTEINPQTDLARLIVEEAENQAYGIMQGDIVVITSKIVSKAEGRVHKLSDVKPSRRAYFLSRLYSTQPEVMEVYLREGEVLGVIPIEKLSKRFGHLYKKYASSREGARKAISEHPYIFLIDVGGRILTWGGVDFSNSPPGYCTSIPKDPDESARRIREGIRRLTGRDVAVVISDTEWKLDKFGTIDIAIGCSGIQPVSRNFGGRDLYGKAKFGGVDDLTDLVSAAANLLFGQTDEATPIAIIRGLRYEKGEEGVKGVIYPREAARKALRTIIWENIKFKIFSKLLKLVK